MVDRNELEDLLWDWMYELLSDEEAAAVRDRVASDPQVARLYAEVQRQAEILAEAAKWEQPAIRLPQPEPGFGDAMAGVEPSTPQPAPRASKTRLPRPARFANWAVALAASLLLGFLGYAYLRPQSPLRPAVVGTAPESIGRQVVRTTLIGPRALHPKAANIVTVLTRSVAGEPRAAEVAYRFYDEDGELVATGECATDSAGFGQIETGTKVGTQPVRLVVEPKSSVRVPAATATIPGGGADLMTYLTTDKPVYQPGEMVRYRSVTLSRFDLQVAREVPVEFCVRDPRGAVVPSSDAGGVTIDGVGSGEFALPIHPSPGRYTVVARSPDGEFAEVRRQIAVAYPHEVELAGAKMLNGKAAFGVPLERQAKSLAARLDGAAAGDMLVDFYPESGELVAGVPNRAYFFAHDARGEPVQVKGRIVDGRGQAVAEAETPRDGRGVFPLTPARGERYRLALEAPGGPSASLALPEASDRQFLAIDASPGVFAAGGPLELRLHSTDCSRPVVISAVCRGVPVGQKVVSGKQWVRTSGEVGSSRVSLRLTDEAEGVIRVTAYDYSVPPPAPVAERLVYRRPKRILQIRVDAPPTEVLAGQPIQLGISVRDDHGRPQPAVLGVSIVGEAVFRGARPRPSSLATHFWLTSEIRDARGLEDANLYLNDDPESARSLDLLLGTQGWRRFITVPGDQLAAAPAAGSVGRPSKAVPTAPEGRPTSILEAALAATDSTQPVVWADNEEQAVAAANRELASLQTARRIELQRVARVLVFGSLLVMGIVLLGAFLHANERRVWIPAFGMAAVCLLLGGVWLLSSGQPSNGFRLLSRTGHGGDRQIAQAVPRNQIAETEEYSQNLQEDIVALGDEARPEDALEAGLDTRAARESAPLADEVAGAPAAPAEPAPAAGAASQATAPTPFRAARPATARDKKAGPFGLALGKESERDAAAEAGKRMAGEKLSEAANAPRGGGLGGGAGGRGGMLPTLGGAQAARPLAEEPMPPAAAAPAAPPPAVPLMESPPPAAERLGAFDGARGRQALKDDASQVDRADKKLGQVNESVAAEDKEAGEAESRRLDRAEGSGQSPNLRGQVAETELLQRLEQVGESRRLLKGQGVSPPAESTPLASEALPVPATSAVRERFPMREYAYGGMPPARAGVQAGATETLYWKPRLIAGRDGKAVVEFAWPGSAAAYRVLVDGHFAGRIGSYQSDSLTSHR